MGLEGLGGSGGWRLKGRAAGEGLSPAEGKAVAIFPWFGVKAPNVVFLFIPFAELESNTSCVGFERVRAGDRLFVAYCSEA